MFNGSEIDKIMFNGQQISKVMFNGANVLPYPITNLFGTDGNFVTNTGGLGTGWTIAGTLSAKSVTDNIQSFTASAKFGGLIKNATTEEAGDIIYFCALVKASSANVGLVYRTGGADLTILHSGFGNFELLSLQGAYVSQGTYTYKFQDRSDSGWAEAQIKKAFKINLTKDIGVSNIPTQAEMDACILDIFAREGYFTQNYYREPVYFIDNFNAGVISPKWGKQLAATYSATVVSTPAIGAGAMKSELHVDDALVLSSRRAELTRTAETPLEEHWYGLSIFLPADYALDPLSSEGLTQWHSVPDDGEADIDPPMMLRTRNGGYYIDRIWDEDAVTTNAKLTAEGKRETISLGSYTDDLGKWVRWVFRVKWGWLPEHNTKLEIFKDGVKVLDRDGLPNTANDLIGTSWKFGLYKWGWASDPNNSILTERIVYYDDVSVDNLADIVLI